MRQMVATEGVAEFEAEVVSDGVRAAVVARRTQLVAPPDRGGLDRRRRGMGAPVRSSGAGCKGGIVTLAESHQQLVEPDARDAVGPGHLTDAAFLE
jgi:hypothetical protein